MHRRVSASAGHQGFGQRRRNQEGGNQSRLFVEFERLDRLKNRTVEGTGLGLSITARLVKLMDGRISVESEYGKGSSFIVQLPQKVVSQEPVGDYRKRFELLNSQEGEEVQETLDSMRFPGKKSLWSMTMR